MGEVTPLQQKLLDNGYRKHVCLSYLSFHSTDTLYQKLIEDKVGKRYYINAWYYPYKVWSQGITTQETIQIEAQLYGKDDEVGVDIRPVTNNDIVKAEEMIHRIWLSEECGYYERWNEC